MLKPYYQDNHDTIYCQDFRKNDLDQNGFGGTTVIQLLNLVKAIFSGLYFIRRDRAMTVPFGSLFALAKCEQDSSLLSLNPKVGQKALNTSYSLSIGHRPSVERFSIPSRWFLDTLIATKVFIKKLNRKAVGYEISEEYCKLSVERLRQQVML